MGIPQERTEFFVNIRRLHPIEWLLALAAALVMTSGVVALQTQSELAERVVRLHVLANSDSQADQALKLEVRDAVLSRTTEALQGVANRTEAQARLQALLPELRTAAESVVADRGIAYSVRVELEETAFPTREYDGFALPAGEYLALRVLIGAAEGQNWWCVVFPPLCTTAAADVPVAALGAGLSEEQVALITEADGGYVLKFKSVELWQALKARLQG